MSEVHGLVARGWLPVKWGESVKVQEKGIRGKWESYNVQEGEAGIRVRGDYSGVAISWEDSLNWPYTLRFAMSVAGKWWSCCRLKCVWAVFGLAWPHETTGAESVHILQICSVWYGGLYLCWRVGGTPAWPQGVDQTVPEFWLFLHSSLSHYHVFNFFFFFNLLVSQSHLWTVSLSQHSSIILLHCIPSLLCLFPLSLYTFQCTHLCFQAS